MAMAEPPLPASQVPVTTPAQFPAPAAAPAAAVSPLQAVLLMVGSVAVFAAMDALVKDLGTRYPTMQVMFFRSLFAFRSEEHTSELQSLMRISYAVFCLKKKTTQQHT